MNRKLILISCDNGGQGFLPGVSIDMQRYESFFRSSIGGAWRDDEIRLYYNNATRDILHDYIMMTEGTRHVDYWLIVFCGHGRTDINERTQMLLSQGNEVCDLDIFTWLRGSRCLIIGDCCRERRVLQGDQLIQEGLIHDRIPDSEVCREAYNDFLRHSPAGIHCRAYAASVHETAGENNNIGGIYSFCLIYAANSLANHNGGNIEQHPYCLSFEVVQNNSAQNVEMLTQNEQHPVSDGNIEQLPFVVVA